jgi:gliding motility-associated-like protein
LPSYNQIPTNFKQQVTTVNAESHQGQSIRRIPDGGSWSNFGSPSYGTCNDPANCDVFSGVSQCNGSATVNVTSGVAPYTFQWDDPLNQVTETAVNLCEGTYNVLVTDANDCSETYQVNVISNPFSINTDVIQPGCLQNNGSISLYPFNSNYTYTWSPNVSITNSASNLSQGSYVITVSEGSCSFDTTIVLQNPTPFAATLVTENTTCGENNGVINVNINPPGNYTLTWTPNVSISQTATSLPAGNYNINISDNICETTLTANVGSSLPISANVQVQNTSCNESNGAIWIDLSPVSNYSYSWLPNVSTADSAMDLPSGNYQIQYSDGECSGDTTLLVAPSDAPNDILYAVSPTNCGTNNGSISITQVAGGQPPYLYSFNSQQIFGITSDTISLSNQNYEIAVIDANGCVYEESVVVSEIPGPSEIVNSKVNPTCGINNGSIFIQGAIGGVSPYIYEFNGQIINDTALLNLSAGSYTVEVRDIFGCSFQKSINLINATGISSIFIPNVFTPNSDDLKTNEFWKVEATCIESLTGEIINRWGDIVFQFDELADSWNGNTESGQPVKDGVYFYKVKINYYDDTSEIFHGHLTVIR